METETSTTTAVTIPAEGYVRTGVTHPDTPTHTGWADTFRAMGGEACTVHPSWRLGMTDPTVVLSGTRESVQWAIDGMAATL